MDKGYLNVTDLMKILGIGRNAAYQMVNQEDFPKIRIGRSIRISSEKLYEYLEAKCWK